MEVKDEYFCHREEQELVGVGVSESELNAGVIDLEFSHFFKLKFLRFPVSFVNSNVSNLLHIFN